jgi:hypothetical protein
MYSFYQGDRSKIKRLTVSGYPALDAAWTGRMVVRENPDVDPVIDRAVSHDGSQFLAVILPDESAQLTPGKTYRWIVEIANATLDIPFRQEVPEEIGVLAQGVAGVAATVGIRSWDNPT